jgi:hypothetical protein
MSQEKQRIVHELIIKRLLDEKAPLLIIDVNKISKN